MEKFSLLTKLAKCTLNIALKLTKMSPVFHPDDSRGKRRDSSPLSTVIWVKNCRSKKGIKLNSA